jgi:DNA polymerase-3 subunit beta
VKFTIDQKALSTALSHVIRAVSDRPTHPILGCVKLEVVDDYLTLTGFDLSTAIVRTVEVVTEQKGTICLSGRLLSDIVGRLPSGNLSFNLVAENTIKIESLSGEFTIQGMDATEYPELPHCKNESFPIDADILLNELRSVLYSASTDPTQQIITGVNIRTEGDEIRLAATDGHRLTVATNQVTGTIPVIDVTIPATALGALVALLDGAIAPSIDVTLDEEQARFSIEGRSLITRILNGNFPKYYQLFPTSFKGSAVVNRKDLQDALGRVSVIDIKHDLTIIKLESGKSTIHRKAESGSANETISVELTGDAIEIGFNGKYLLEAVKNLAATDIKITFNTPATPIIISPLSGDSADHAGADNKVAPPKNLNHLR